MKNTTNKCIYSLAKDGDRKEAIALRDVYNTLLDVKLQFVEKAFYAKFTPYQRAEADIKLASLTGELKRIDAAITQLIFPDLDYVNTGDSMTLMELAKTEVKNNHKQIVESLNKKIYQLSKRNANYYAQSVSFNQRINQIKELYEFMNPYVKEEITKILVAKQLTPITEEELLTPSKKHELKNNNSTNK